MTIKNKTNKQETKGRTSRRRSIALPMSSDVHNLEKSPALQKEKQEIEKEKRFEWKKIVIGIIVLIIVIIVLIEVYNYPKDYSCYQYECTKTNLEDFDRCIDIGYEGCGFLCSNHYYLCDGIKVIKKCLETREINQEIKVNILDIINHRCSSLK